MTPEQEEIVRQFKPSFDIVDHVARAEFFLNCARNAQDLNVLNWCTMAAISSCRAVPEIIMDRIKKGAIDGSLEEFGGKMVDSIRHYKIIEYLRIHDFHRGAIRFDPRTMGVVGNIKVSSGDQAHGLAAAIINPCGGIEASRKRNGRVSFDRPVQIRGFEVYDENVGEFIAVDCILQNYLADLKGVLHAYYPDIHWGQSAMKQAEEE